MTRVWVRCPLACIAAADILVDTHGHARIRSLQANANSHIVHPTPSSTSGLDTPFIPHLAPSSWISRARCGMGFGVGCRCAFRDGGSNVLAEHSCQKCQGKKGSLGRRELMLVSEEGSAVGRQWGWRQRPPSFPWTSGQKYLRFRTASKRKTGPESVAAGVARLDLDERAAC
jgi:hypothetical protein